jgi:heme exporter protein CcmD
MNTLIDFLQMGGYGWYVWGAYGTVLSSLAMQWFISWRRWQRHHNKNHE